MGAPSWPARSASGANLQHLVIVGGACCWEEVYIIPPVGLLQALHHLPAQLSQQNRLTEKILDTC